MLKNRLPQQLSKLRAIRNLSLSDLAKLSGVSKSTIAEIETGQAKNVTLVTILKLCQFFGVSLDEITGFFDDVPHIKRPGTWAGSTLVNMRPVCLRCNGNLRRGERHFLEECIMHLHENAVSRERISALCEVGVSAVDKIIADVLSRRLGRRLRPVIAAS